MVRREHVLQRENDYSHLEAEYLRLAGAELVLDPWLSPQKTHASGAKSASVLIGSYNSRVSLEKSLRSIAQSSFNARYPDRLEVIVGDDGSSDGTEEMIAALDPGVRLKYVRQDNGGLTAAHNTALSFAEGDVLIFSDSDIVHTPYAIEEMIKRHEVLDHVTLVGFRFEADPVVAWEELRHRRA